MPPRGAPGKGKKAKNTKKNPAQPPPPQPFVLTKDMFDSDLSNLYYEAWTHRGSEYHLYPLYNHIISVNCFTLRHRNAPRVSVAPCPQPLFGPLPPAVRLGDTAPPLKADNKTTLKSQFPDFARILVYSDTVPLPDGSHPVRHVIDAWELKPLNSGSLWWSTDSRLSAERSLPAFLEQCQDQAEAGFANNPDWTRLYTLLIVGPYFTQLVWKDRPPEETLRFVEAPETSDVSDPEVMAIKSKDYAEPIAAFLEEIKHYEKRILPEVLSFNAPVFAYDIESPESDSYHPVSLSPEFLWALADPVTNHYPDIPVEPTSWFYPGPETTARPPMTVGDKTLAHTKLFKGIKGDKIDKLKQEARALGHVFPGDKGPAVTPSPPVSKLDKSTQFASKKRNAPDAVPLITRASAKARAARAAEAAALDLVAFPFIVEDVEGEVAGQDTETS